jgi:DNA primase
VVTTKPAAPKPSVTPAMALPSIKSFIKTNNDNAIQIVYVEKGLKGKTDTILVEIDKTKKAQPEISPVAVIESKIKDSVQANKVDVVQPALSMEMQAPKAVDCTNPIAMPKDMRELQRKMVRASSDAEQVELVVKAFGEKCFTCKQTKELGLYFLDEQKRLDFYSRVRNLVSDPAIVLITAFLTGFILFSSLVEVNVGTSFRHRSVLMIPMVLLYLRIQGIGSHKLKRQASI